MAPNQSPSYVEQLLKEPKCETELPRDPIGADQAREGGGVEEDEEEVEKMLEAGKMKKRGLPSPLDFNQNLLVTSLPQIERNPYTSSLLQTFP